MRRGQYTNNMKKLLKDIESKNNNRKSSEKHGMRRRGDYKRGLEDKREGQGLYLSVGKWFV